MVHSPLAPRVSLTLLRDLRISGDDNNHVYFHGLIDEVEIFNRALTQPDEITRHLHCRQRWEDQALEPSRSEASPPALKRAIPLPGADLANSNAS